MKRHLVTAALVSMAASAAWAEPSLVGKWISDRDASASFNEKHVQMQAKTAAFHRDSMGRLVVTFAAETMSYELPNFTTKIEGKQHSIVGFSETHPYTVVATTPHSVAIRTVEPVSHAPTIVVYNFVDNDHMWIYVSTLGSHIREYFRRVEPK